MNCNDARALIAQGDLPGGHLASCAQCRVYADEMARLGKALGLLIVEAPDMALTVPRRRPRNPVLLAAAVLLILIVSAFGAKLIIDNREVVPPNPPTKKMRILDSKKDAGAPPPRQKLR